MPITAHCPKCKRLAYLSGGKCEFCGYQLPPEVVGRIVVPETVREHVAFSGTHVVPEESPNYFQESVDRKLFEAYDQLNAVFVELSRRRDTQHEAAYLGAIIESLGELRNVWKHRE